MMERTTAYNRIEMLQVADTVAREKGIDIGRELPQPWADEIVRAATELLTEGAELSLRAVASR
jgi:hypothetical protein